MKVEDNWRIYKGEDAILQLPTSFSRSVHYEVLSFAYFNGEALEVQIVDKLYKSVLQVW